MNKVVILGFFGFENIGDEVILETLIQQIRGISDTKITVLSKTPKETSKKYGVRSVHRYNAFAVLWEIATSKLLISGGGSLLQDKTSKRSIYYYLSVFFLAITTFTPIILLSNGIGPIEQPINRKLVSFFLRRAVHSTLRDEDSKDLLIQIGVPGNKLSVSADMVLSHEYSPKEKTLRQRKKILIALRNKDFPDSIRNSGDNSTINEISNQPIVKLINMITILSSKYDVSLLPFYQGDDDILIDRLKHHIPGNVRWYSDKFETGELLDLIADADILIGSRLHSLIFALVTHTPYIAVSYDPKIDSFMHFSGKKVATTIDNFDEYAIFKELCRIEDNYEEEVESIKKAKESMSMRMKINEDLLRQFL